MEWRKGRRSDNVVQDTGGGRGGRVGIGAVLLAVVLGLVFHKNPLEILSLLSNAGGGASAPQTVPVEGGDEQTEFVRAILGSTEDTWGAVFQAGGQQYPPPKLVLFRGQVASACGAGSAAMGPFYCPGDSQVYLDLSFFQEMATKFNAAGDLARAYVVAHEVGHHVQNVIGVMEKVDRQRAQGAAMEGPRGLSVRQELQADCFAGVWANRAQQQLNWLQAGDVEGALAAATSIGDDTLQRQSQGRVVPDAFTHGSAAQRVRWFQQGMQSGRVDGCDTFKVQQP
jgi:predicted metalloprotease